MRPRITPLLAGLAIAALACAPTDPPAPTVDLAAEDQAVRAVSMRWLELEKARDAAGIAALFVSDGMLIREKMAPVVGQAAIQTHIAGNHAENPSAAPHWATDRVEIAASGDLAVEHGTWSETGMGADGTGSDEGKYMTLYRKVNGMWMVVTDVALSTKPETAGS